MSAGAPAKFRSGGSRAVARVRWLARGGSRGSRVVARGQCLARGSSRAVARVQWLASSWIATNL